MVKVLFKKKINNHIIMVSSDGSIIKVKEDKKSGKFSGNFSEGVYVSKENDIYVGQWKNFKRNGFGKQIHKNGSIYKGFWKDNRRHGTGINFNKYGQIFVGKFINDNVDDSIKSIILDSNQFYTGSIKNKIIDNKLFTCKENGISISNDFSVFRGKWSKGKKKLGMIKFLNGFSFEGTWKDNHIYNGKILDNNKKLLTKVIKGKFINEYYLLDSLLTAANYQRK